jgi:hypothetical protein
MNMMNLLLAALFGFLASNKETPGTLSDLARLAKGRILALSIKEGMAQKEVDQLLGLPDGLCSSSGFTDVFWVGYGVYVRFAGFHDGKYDPHVIRVSFGLPPELKWENLCRRLTKEIRFSSLKGDAHSKAPDSK